MENKKIKIDFEYEFNLPKYINDSLINGSQIPEWMNEWIKLIDNDKRKEKRELRLKKINEINAKYK